MGNNKFVTHGCANLAIALVVHDVPNLTFM